MTTATIHYSDAEYDAMIDAKYDDPMADFYDDDAYDAMYEDDGHYDDDPSPYDGNYSED